LVFEFAQIASGNTFSESRPATAEAETLVVARADERTGMRKFWTLPWTGSSADVSTRAKKVFEALAFAVAPSIQPPVPLASVPNVSAALDQETLVLLYEKL